MKVAVWGAGAVGTSAVYRLAAVPHVSEIRWINRSMEHIQSRAIDIEHGLAFAPSCHEVLPVPQEAATRALESVDLLLISAGGAVPEGGSRSDLYQTNAGIFRETIIPVLCESEFSGFTLVVSNPVDFLTRLLVVEGGLNPSMTCSLGTLVETARLRSSLAKNLGGRRVARQINAYAVGTHDEKFVPVFDTSAQPGLAVAPKIASRLLEASRIEVIRAARRVKRDGQSTLHPIVEGVVQVAEAYLLDQKRVLTVGVADESRPGRLVYSRPSVVGRDGVEPLEFPEGFAGTPAGKALDEALEAMLRDLDDF